MYSQFLQRKTSMKTHLVQIGNSRGVRLPKSLIEKAGLTGEVELRVQEGAIIIARAVPPRSGWAEAARNARQRQEDRLLEGPTPTRFDDEEWAW
jgi:antitoxin MazE